MHLEVEVDELLGLQFEAPLADDVALVLLRHYQVVYRAFAAQAGNLRHVLQIHPLIIIIYSCRTGLDDSNGHHYADSYELVDLQPDFMADFPSNQ